MPSQKNINQLQELKEKFEKAKSVVLSDYRGLKVEQINKLRKQIKEVNGEFKVSKNSLLKLSLKNFHNPPNTIQFTGPTGVLFSYKDEIAPIKVLYNFYKKNRLPKIKLGFLNPSPPAGRSGQVQFLTKDKVIELAKLPTREALQGKLIGSLNSPISGFVHVLKGNLTGLVVALKAIQRKAVKINGKK